MTIYIKEWPNRAVTLFTESGQELWTFSTLDDAMIACRDWYSNQDEDENLDMDIGTDMEEDAKQLPLKPVMHQVSNY